MGYARKPRGDWTRDPANGVLEEPVLARPPCMMSVR